MVVVPRYDCSRCEREGLLADEMALTGRARRSDGRACASWCRRCRSEKQKEYDDRRRPEMRATARAHYAFNKRLDPEGMREKERQRKRRQLATPEGRRRSAEASRRWRQKMKADPERHARYLEGQRVAYRRRRRAAGKDPTTRLSLVKTTPKGDTLTSERAPQVPSLPVWEAIESFMRREQLTMRDFAAGSGIDERTLQRWRTQVHPKAEYPKADDALTYMGLLPIDVWDGEVLAKLGW